MQSSNIVTIFYVDVFLQANAILDLIGFPDFILAHKQLDASYEEVKSYLKLRKYTLNFQCPRT